MQVAELLDIFTPERCIFGMKAKSKEEALNELVTRLVKVGYIKDREIFLQLLRAREQLGSTSIGKGVAIPHARSVAASELIAVFGLSTKGIAFRAPDRRPTHLFFLIIAPPQDKGNRYLPLLGRIVETVRDPKTRRKLVKCTNYDEFAEAIAPGSS